MEITATRKKFEIVNSGSPYQPREQAMPPFKVVAGDSSNCESNAGESHRLYLTREAMSHIRSHIAWNDMTPHNCVEQGGIMLGQTFHDSERGITYGVVSAAVAGLSARGSSVHLEMTHDTWKEMLDSADRLLAQSPHKELQVIGWYHTHPNGLDVYMSGTDRETQSRMFAQDWQFAIVLNPQKRRWRAFFGREARECRGYVIADEADEAEAVDPEHEEWPHGQTRDFNFRPAQDEDVSHRAAKFLACLQAWGDAPHRLLWTCVAVLLLVLLLQCVSVGIQVIGLFFGR